MAKKLEKTDTDNSRSQKGNKQLIILFSLSWDCRIYSIFCFDSVGVPNFYDTYNYKTSYSHRRKRSFQCIALTKSSDQLTLKQKRLFFFITTQVRLRKSESQYYIARDSPITFKQKWTTLDAC